MKSISNQYYELFVPNEAYNSFILLYKSVFKRAFPIIKTKPNKKYIKKEPWMTSGLLTSMRNKAKLLSKKLKKPTYINIMIYKFFVNQYNKIKRQIKIRVF